MSKFIEPKTKTVAFSVTLRKDLTQNEELCPECNGLGILIKNNVYGLSGDRDSFGLPRFPYKHQSLVYCSACFNGVVRRCEFCNEIIPRVNSKCNCEKQREIDYIEFQRKETERLEKAPEAPQEILEKSLMFFSEDYGENDGYFSDWEDFFEFWFDNHNADDQRPKYVWATEPYDMKIDAANIIESATKDLYEDAYHDISEKKADELQDFLNEWCKTSGVRTTYYQSKYKVEIPWSDYEI